MLPVTRSKSLSTVTVIIVGLALILLTITSSSIAEIHRAKSISSKPHHAGRSAAIKHRLIQAQQLQASTYWNVSRLIDVFQEWLQSITDNDRFNVWSYSLLSAGLVGLSGIFPLLVIPLEAGEALKRGGSANNRLKLLLSFAVGGLLGDVFLHLLPEAWAHIDKLGGAHDGHINIGCWVLTGLLLFMIIEKVFPESSEEEDEHAVEETNVQQTRKCGENGKQAHNTNGCSKNGLQINDHIKNVFSNSCFMKNGDVVCSDDRGKMSETSDQSWIVQRKETNGFVHKNGMTGTDHTNGLSKNGIEKTLKKKNKRTKQNDEDEVEEHQVVYSENKQAVHSVDVTHSTSIKTSGWLNLMANVVDNFTHGLAVAGSYSVGMKTGLITTFAILLHEVPHEIGDFAILLRAGFDRWRAAKAQLLTATGGILGAVAALTAESAQSAGDKTAWILPFTAGGFIYISMVTVLPDLLRENTDARQSLKQFLFVCMGIAVMAAVTILVD